MLRARAALGFVWLAALAAGPELARAQPPEDPAAVARRVHEEGGYADDVTLLTNDGTALGGGAGAGAGAGRGPRGETSIDGERVLDEPAPTPEMPEWLRRALDWLATTLSGLAGPLGYTFLVLGLAAIALLVAFGVAALRFRSPPVHAGRAGDGAAEPVLDPFLVGTGESAEALAAQGRWREAIHALFLHSLREVGGAEGRLRSRTARELVAAVERDRPGRAELASLLDLAERVWFGGREATEAQYHEARGLAGVVARAEPRR